MSIYRKPYQVDIVIPGWNQMAMTLACLKGILGSNATVPYRITYVDNGSDEWPAVAGPASHLAGHQIIALPFNHGYCRGVNAGLALANLSDAPYVVVMNNDVQVPASDTGWLERWIAYFDDPTVGLAGAVTANALRCQAYPTARIPDPPPYDDVPVLTAFAMMIRKATLRTVGLMDERYEPGQFDDFDYCLRVRLAGFRCVVAKSVWVDHKVEGTTRHLPLNAIRETNIKKFVQKWGLNRLNDMGVVHAGVFE